MKLDRFVAASLVAIAGLSSGVFAQAPADAGAVQVASSGIPQRDTLLKLMATYGTDLPKFEEKPLKDIMDDIAKLTGVEIDVMWQDDRNNIGLDKQMAISVDPRGLNYLTLIERVLSRAVSDTSGTKGNTWQLTEEGALQVGPRERLEKFMRVEIYDINDLLMEIPDYTNAPEFDLNSVLSGGGGSGGSSQSPFKSNTQNGQNSGPSGKPVVPKEDRAKALTDLLVQLCEPSAWDANGEGPSTMKYYQGMMIINAPDYVHRALDGYPYWPKSLTSFATQNGRRYVSLNGSTSTSKINGFKDTPVSAVVGGQIIRSDGSKAAPSR